MLTWLLQYLEGIDNMTQEFDIEVLANKIEDAVTLAIHERHTGAKPVYIKQVVAKAVNTDIIVNPSTKMITLCPKGTAG